MDQNFLSFFTFYFQPQDLEAFGSKNSVFKTEKDTNLVSRNIKKNVTKVQYVETLYCNISSSCFVTCRKRLTVMICFHAFNWMKTNFGLFLESSYGNTQKFLSFNSLIDTFNHFRIQKIKYSRTRSMTSNDLGDFSCRRRLITVSIFRRFCHNQNHVTNISVSPFFGREN